jgi:uncharacterized protein (DUF1800 family)
MPSSDQRARQPRRQVLKASGALAAAAVLGAPRVSFAATASQQATSPNAAAVAPALPPLEIIALNRLAFGPRPGDIDAFRQLPGSTDREHLAAYVDQQLNPQTIDDSACEARLNAAEFITLGKPLAQLWADHVVNPPEDRGYEWRNLPLRETIDATIIRAVYSRRQLFEVLVDFWHNHFNVFGESDGVPPVFVHYDRDVIRTNALGNFRRLLEGVGTSPAMLFYLDNNSNQVAGPNENYARELFELHTMGADNYLGVQDPRKIKGFDEHNSVGYVDNDVYEAARAFTGWRVDTGNNRDDSIQNSGTFIYYKQWHDRFNKQVLGRYLPHDQADMQDGREVFDMLAAHPGTARHISMKLARRLISDQPPPEVVTKAAEVFRAQADAPDQLAQVVRSIVLSDAFRQTWGEKIKRPFEVAASMMRALNPDLSRPPGRFHHLYASMGQPLFGHPAPNGYSDVRQHWSGTTSILYRWKLATALAGNELHDDERSMPVDLLSQTPPGVRSANAAADFWIDRILGRPMTPGDRGEVVRAMAQADSPDAPLADETFAKRLAQLVELILMSPDFQWR